MTNEETTKLITSLQTTIRAARNHIKTLEARDKCMTAANDEIIAELRNVAETMDGIFADMRMDARFDPLIDALGKVIDVLRERWGEA